MAMIDRRVLTCLAILLANDWWLKAAQPGWISGKLSDFAGIVVFAATISTVLLWLGFERRKAAYSGAVAAGTALVTVKLSSSAASAVVAVLETTTRTGHTIVADPTDLLALAALPLAVAAVQQPRPLVPSRGPGVRRVCFTVFGVACIACAASSVEEGPFLTHVDTSESGEIVVGRTEFEDNVTAVLSIDAEGNVNRASPSTDVEWSLTTESCSPVDPNLCLSVGPDTAINESNDGGDSYSQKWAIDDGGWWHVDYSTEASDIEWLPDGTAFVAMTSMNPVRRSADGSFTPSIASLHPYPIVVVGFALVAWLIAAEAAFFANRRRSAAGTTLFGLATLIALGSSLLGMAGPFGPVLAILLGTSLIAICLASGYVAFAVQRSRDRKEGVEPPAERRAPWWTFFWPFPVIVLAGLAWDADLVPWIVTLALVFGSVLVGWPMLWGLRPKPTP